MQPDIVDEEEGEVTGGQRIVIFSILTFVSFMLTLYFYNRPDTPVDRSNLIQIRGRLADTPRSYHSSEKSADISIALTNDDTKYRLTNCSFRTVDQRLFDMYPNDSITLTVENEDYDNRTSWVNSTVSVLAIDDSNGRSLLRIDAIDGCSRNSWRVMLQLSYVCLAVTILASARRIWNFFKPKNG